MNTSLACDPNIQKRYIPPIQSADTLFNYMKKLDYLLSAIDRQALVPRYVVEDVSYLNINQRFIAIPEKCFCDIKFEHSKSHMKKYGKFGIGLSKKWGIMQGVQPVHYINPMSVTCHDFRQAFLSALKVTSENVDVQNVENELLTHLIFMKPLFNNINNFHDEREWRFVPSFEDSDLPQIVSNEYIESERSDENPLIKRLNSTLDDHDKFWLKFTYEDIKYIIVNSQTSKNKLCDFIGKLNCNKKRKRDLLTKISVYKEMQRDL